MECRRHVATLWVLCLLGNAFCVPAGERRRRGYAENELDFPKESAVPQGSSDSLSKSPEDVSPPPSTSTLDPFDDDDDDDDAVFSEPMQTSSTGGSNILSLLRLAGALFPSSSGATQTRNDQQPSSSPIWTLKMDILRAFLQFATNIMGQASASSSNAITT